MAKFFVLISLILTIHVHLAIAETTLNVLKYGARGNGASDSAQAFESAWAAACASNGPTTIYVPKGRYLVGSSLAFNGPCKSSFVTLRIDGTLLAPMDYRVLGKYENWISFDKVSGLSIVGGSLDAKGSGLWACKASASGSSCPNGATTLSVTNSNNVIIKGLVSLNSQMYHIVINHCNNVNVEGIKVIASGKSPNTDGIHVQQSTNVKIIGSSIKTGDDCVSIGPATKNLWIEDVVCGPGHGISIGSLGKDMEEEGVQNVTVKKTTFVGTQNGFRIKSWARPSTGFVEGVQFIDAIMQNVQNPVIIDQHYCPHNLNCPNQVSGVKISNVKYQNIRGTSATPVAIKFDCSAKSPCKGIQLQNVNLLYMKEPAQSSCAHVTGQALGIVKPNNCL